MYQGICSQKSLSLDELKRLPKPTLLKGPGASQKRYAKNKSPIASAIKLCSCFQTVTCQMRREQGMSANIPAANFLMLPNIKAVPCG